jgi:hypothetical protein
MRTISSIEEEFVILNRYKDRLEKELENAKSDKEKETIKRDIQSIDNIMSELQIEANEIIN